MSNSNNNDPVFDRLKKKAERPTVPPRNTSLTKSTNAQLQNDEINKFSHSEPADNNTSPANTSVSNEQTAPKEEVPPKLPETVRRTIRLETEIDSQLDTFCNKHKITRDNFMEAAFAICISDEVMRDKMLKEAQKRYQERKRAGEQRKYQTLAKKLKSLS